MATAAASVEGEDAAAAFMVADLVEVGFATAASETVFAAIGLSSLAILTTRSFTIPTHTTGTTPMAIILMATDMDTVAFAVVAFATVIFTGVAFTAVVFTAVALIVALTAMVRTGADNEPVYQGSAGYTPANSSC